MVLFISFLKLNSENNDSPLGDLHQSFLDLGNSGSSSNKNDGVNLTLKNGNINSNNRK